ncbi:cytochrome c oxidase assembly protein COX19 [Buteo buteo]|uniref:cytochrome c oxidase assembly protein COX19 n=1 Tax=Buteo buteo TaxID=30397 RepID=UPI003EB7E8EC
MRSALAGAADARCSAPPGGRCVSGGTPRFVRLSVPVPSTAGDMSTAMNFGTKSFKPRPPDKGAFPLDHFGECSAFKERFMECLRQSGYESGACRQRAMAYLECRMERQLMANEPLEKLGFKDLIDEKSEAKPEKL